VNTHRLASLIIRVTVAKERKMAAASNDSGTSDSTSSTSSDPDERLKKLYPAVNEEETPLPRSWSAKDKYNYLGLSQNNLRVHYKGRHFVLVVTTKSTTLTFLRLYIFYKISARLSFILIKLLCGHVIKQSM